MATADDDTITLTKGERSFQPFSPVPQLCVCFRCKQPLEAPPSRHLLAGVEVVEIGRGSASSTVRGVVGGTRTLKLALPDGRVSSRHSRMTRASGQWVLEDLGSKNGTQVNGVADRRFALRDGDLIEIGHTFLIFRDQVRVDPRDKADLFTDELELPDVWKTLHGPLLTTYRELLSLASASLPVLVLGETGTGKEVVVQTLHRLSGRPGSCVVVNCAAIADSLAEAELFGHSKGAFTGSSGDRIGRIRQADQGTLFLDEIGELSASLQAILLRTLETRTVCPVGSDRTVPVDFRLVAATNVDLDRAVESNDFRADLRARLGRLVVRLPALRHRPEDIGLLTRLIVPQLEGGHDEVPFDPLAARALLTHRWPGNVRELVQTLTLALVRARGGTVRRHHLGPELASSPLAQAPELVLNPEHAQHREELRTLLEEVGGNVAELCRRLGVHRQTAHRWFKRYGLDPAGFRR